MCGYSNSRVLILDHTGFSIPDFIQEPSTDFCGHAAECKRSCYLFGVMVQARAFLAAALIAPLQCKIGDCNRTIADRQYLHGYSPDSSSICYIWSARASVSILREHWCHLGDPGGQVRQQHSSAAALNNDDPPAYHSKL